MNKKIDLFKSLNKQKKEFIFNHLNKKMSLTK